MVPPATEIGTITPLQQIIARSDRVAVILSTTRAFSTGCLVEAEVVLRRGSLPSEQWSDLREALFGSLRFAETGPLPDWLLRFGVRFADGAKATTITSAAGQPPTGPLLSWVPQGSGSRGGGEYAFANFGLWLWPLPTAQRLEFAAEWPLGGLALTFTELDGATIAAAGQHPRHYWDD
jgi:hypothetical protein